MSHSILSGNYSGPIAGSRSRTTVNMEIDSTNANFTAPVGDGLFVYVDSGTQLLTVATAGLADIDGISSTQCACDEERVNNVGAVGAYNKEYYNKDCGAVVWMQTDLTQGQGFKGQRLAVGTGGVATPAGAGVPYFAVQESPAVSGLKSDGTSVALIEVRLESGVTPTIV